MSIAVEWLAPLLLLLLHIQEVPESHDQIVGDPASYARGSFGVFIIQQ